MSKESRLLAIGMLALVMIIWLATPFLVMAILKKPLLELGQFGDIYGSVNALFSGLAFVGIVIAIYLQQQELDKTQAALFRSLEQAKEDRRQESHLALLERLNENNWHYAADEARLLAIEIFYQYKVPRPEEGITDRRLYWATRLLHIGHINMLEQAWTVSRTGSREEFSNWERLARILISHLKDCGDDAIGRPEPYRQACRDIWREFHSMSRAQADFIKWLSSLDGSTG